MRNPPGIAFPRRWHDRLARLWRRVPLPSHRLVLALPVLLALLHASGLWRLSGLDALDASLYDARLRLLHTDRLDPRIVIVDIDEKSLAEQGRWPWGRDRVARLVDELFERQHIAVLGFDVVFAEPDTSSGLARLRQLAAGELADQPAFQRRVQALEPVLDHDARLARAFAGRAVVLGYYFNQDPRGRNSGTLPAPVMGADTLLGRDQRFTLWSGYGANIAPLARAAPMAGFFNPLVDPDGIVRAMPLLAEYQGQVYESLVLAMYREAQGRPAVDPLFAGTAQGAAPAPLRALRLRPAAGPGAEVPVGPGASALVPFRGQPGAQGGAFRYVPATDLIERRLGPDQLQGRLVLVGSSAPGLQDLRATPLSPAAPGVEIHAQLLSGLLDGRVPYRPDYAAGYEALVVLVVGLVLVWTLPRLPAVAGVLAIAGAVAGVGVLGVALQAGAGLVLPQAASFAMMVGVLLLHLLGTHLFASRARRELLHLFGTYVPPELVDEMVRHPRRYTMEATSRELTVMFCDMRGFTCLAETMEPLQLQALLNNVLTRLSELIRENQGTIDKYMGDCVMAFWGAPVPAADHARRAVRTALDLAAAVEQINQDHRARGLPLVAFGIGLSTGMMCVGDMGSRLRRAYTVIGDAVNLGARLQELTPHYGVDILASETTRRQAPGFDWQELDRVRLRGRQAPVGLFRPWPQGAASRPDALGQALRSWEAFLGAWRRQDWAAAAGLLDVVRRQGDAPRLFALYAARLTQYRLAPPDPGWDGSAEAPSG